MSGALAGVCPARRCPSRTTWEARHTGDGTPAEAAEACQKSGEKPLNRLFASNDFLAFPLVAVTSVVFRPRPKRSHLRRRRQATASPMRGRELLVLLMDAEISQCGQRARDGRSRCPGPKSKRKKKPLTVRAQWPQPPSQAKSSRVRSGAWAHLAQYNQVREERHFHNTRIEVRPQIKTGPTQGSGSRP